jgi:hypothetical protein
MTDAAAQIEALRAALARAEARADANAAEAARAKAVLSGSEALIAVSLRRMPRGYDKGGYPWLPDSGLHAGSSGHRGCPASRF